jgi:hypothetical protein
MAWCPSRGLGKILAKAFSLGIYGDAPAWCSHPPKRFTLSILVGLAPERSHLLFSFTTLMACPKAAFLLSEPLSNL